MPDPNPSVGELLKAKAVTDDEVNAAVDTYLTDPETGTHPIADRYSLDLFAAVACHGWASRGIANRESSPGLRHNAVRTAILLAWVEKA